MRSARMMHTGARTCILADVRSGDPDLHPVLGSARPQGLEGSCLMPTRDERLRSASARGRLWLWVGRVLVALVGLILLVLLVGVVYQFVATRIA